MFKKIKNDTKVVVLDSMAPLNVGFTKENDQFVLKTRVFSRVDKSSRVRSIALSVLERARVFKFFAVRHLTMNLGFQMTWPTLDRIS